MSHHYIETNVGANVIFSVILFYSMYCTQKQSALG